MAEYITKEQVIDWFSPYGHFDKPIPFETLISDLRVMKAADVEPVQEWISVKDRLPEPKELVLCIWKDINGIHYGFARYQHDNVWYVSNEGMPEVTHWMALPKKPQPPKGE